MKEHITLFTFPDGSKLILGNCDKDYLPAPEEVRTFKEYVKLIKEVCNPELAKYYLKEYKINNRTVKQYFDHCWEDEDAEMLHQSWIDGYKNSASKNITI